MAARAVIAALLAAGTALAGATPCRAGDEPTFRIEFRDGVITPARLETPARTRFRLELVNAGREPAEFESLALRKEKVIAPGVVTVMVIRTLEEGSYAFFDDFHPSAPPAVLVATPVARFCSGPEHAATPPCAGAGNAARTTGAVATGGQDGNVRAAGAPAATP